jgi:hypothetical protein
MPDDFRSRILKMKWGNIRIRASGDMTAVVWKDKCDMHMLTNIHDPPADSNLCDHGGNTLTPAIVEDYNQHMGSCR